MRTSIRLLPIVALSLLALPGSSATGADKSWVKARTEFLRAFDANRPEDRKDAIYDHLEGQDRPEAVRLLLRVALSKDDEPAMVVAAAIEILGDLRADASLAAMLLSNNPMR